MLAVRHDDDDDDDLFSIYFRLQAFLYIFMSHNNWSNRPIVN